MRVTGMLLVLAVVGSTGAQPPADLARQARTAAFEKILLGEDRRDAALIREAMAEDPSLRRRGIRALGRLEHPDLIRIVAPALNDNVGIRAEAANALAQLARTPEAASAVMRLLIDRAAADAELGTWEPWGEIAAALGRLPFGSAAEAAEAEAVLVQGLPAPDSLADVDTAALAGSVRGLEALARTMRARRLGTFSPRTWDLLRWAATAQRPAADPRSALIRRRAMAALIAGGEVTPSVIDRALLDTDMEVRRLAAQAAGADGAVSASAPLRAADRAVLLKRALADRDAHVRWEALRAWGRQLQQTSCAPLLAALEDTDPHVRLQAIDLLGGGCPSGEDAVAALGAVVDALDSGLRTWHAPAHALVSLARLAPERAGHSLARFAAHPTWQVRMYAARAAAVLQRYEALAALARDPVDNVREAALAALIEAKREEAVPLALEALTRSDYQLVLTATRAFADPALMPKAAEPLATALGRITKERKDTSRDVRLAILDRLDALGARAQAAVLEGYLTDFDPRVAGRAAEMLRVWTGSPRTPRPQPLPPPGVTAAMVDSLRGRTLRVHMASGGRFDIGLDVEAAPLTVTRVARRAQEGYYDGLTFHRVAPNFVIQGGGPGANEYSGDALYMRDEVGLPHLRGTAGISTRGRDTGDAQIFVNLVDSPRLDHVYTVFGAVTAGMDVVDGILEGDAIERVELVPPTGRR